MLNEGPVYAVLAIALQIALLIFCLVVAVLLVVRPGLRADRPVLASFAALGAVLLLGGGGRSDGMSPWFLPLALAIVLLVPAVVVARAFGRIDLVAILFHRRFGMEGANLRELKNEIGAAVLLAVLVWMSAVLLVGVMAPLWPGGGPWLLCGIAAVFLATNPVLRVGVARLVQPAAPSVLVESLVQPRLRPAKADDPDILIVYLEGTDRRFADPALFAAAARKLDLLAGEGISLVRIGQMLGTGWSLAGMVASQAGVPVAPHGFRFTDKRRADVPFMPNIPFLGDVLAARGYARHFLVGGATAFGGINTMYRGHGIPEMTGLTEITAMFPPEEVEAAYNGWVVDDQMVLDAARRVAADLVQRPEPFALIVETYAPHGPDGLLSRRHGASGRAEKTDDFGRTVACLIDEVSDFMADLRAMCASRRRALRIILLSDHLNHTPSLPLGGPGFAGFNTVFLLGDPDRKGIVVDRPGAMVDVFPTVLDWLGWADAPVAAGIGRSLLSDAPTLVEAFGLERLDAMLASDADFSRAVWAPAAQDGRLANQSPSA